MWFSYIELGIDTDTAELITKPIQAVTKEEAIKAVQETVKNSSYNDLIVSACVVSGQPDNDGELIIDTISESFLIALNGENLETPIVIIL